MARLNSKKVKLQPKVRQLTYSQKVVPELKLSGVWLERLGFKAGCIVKITAVSGQLVIETA